MPELPEVESLARFVTERAGGQEVARAELSGGKVLADRRLSRLLR